ncbi:MAG: response regulator [Deltaproteobacteria bacterium]|nr:response regulator [Deltaproteobacteria bacterium]
MIQQKSGALMWVRASSRPVWKGKGVIGVQGILTDITDKKYAEMQVREAEIEKERLIAQLQQAQKMEAIGTLAGGIAHDFNNILTPIIMGTEMVMTNVPPENMAHPVLKKVLEAGVRAKELVQQILTFSRQSDLEKRPLRLIPLLKESLKMARSTLPSSIEIRQNLNVERDLILANPTQVHQVMMNMFTNAAHAMREGGGILEFVLEEETLDDAKAAKVPELTSGRFLKMKVRDTGHGMDRWTMSQIFDPFFTTKERGEGTGLGLSIVHGIVRSCQGAIRVESQKGKGTTFTIYLPSLKALAAEPIAEEKPIPRGTQRILLVDDEAVIVEMYSEILRCLGYTVDSSVDPLRALDLFRADPACYDLVITDMTMPKMRGDRLAAEVMRLRPEIPVILCTGFSDQISESIAREMGIRAFVMKPIVIGDIAEKIRRVLEGGT